MKEGMIMPGFTAETSLYKPRRHYALMVGRSGAGQVVIPQNEARLKYPLCDCVSLEPGGCCYQKISTIVHDLRLVCHVD